MAMSITSDQALENLRSIGSRLSDTIKEYLSACQLAQSACMVNPDSSTSSFERERALRPLDAELSAFSSKANNLQESRNVLLDTLSFSKMTSPIYALPSEILARIFVDAACNCLDTSEYNPVPPISSPITLASVCRRWRKVAVQHKYLWTHLDLAVYSEDTGQKYPASEIWQHRSHGAPLSVHIIQSRSPDRNESNEEEPSYDIHEYPSPMVNRLLDFLTPLLHQTCSMTLILYWPRATTPHLILDTWGLHVIPEIARSLEIRSRSQFRILQTHDLYSSHAFAYLKTLYLWNVTPPWSVWKLYSLTELHLQNLTGNLESLSQHEVKSMLSGCPNLERLLVQGFFIPDPEYTSSSRAILNKLKMIEIIWGFKGGLGNMLDVIDSGQNSVCVTISFTLIEKSEQYENLVALRLFMNRCNVTFLHLLHYSWWLPCFLSQLGCLPRVYILVLAGLFLSDVANYTEKAPDTNDNYCNPAPLIPGAILWPDLRILYLDDCGIEKEHAYQLLSSHSVQEIYIRRCHNHYRFSERRQDLTAQRFVDELSKTAPTVKDLTDEPGKWPSRIPDKEYM